MEKMELLLFFLDSAELPLTALALFAIYKIGAIARGALLLSILLIMMDIFNGFFKYSFFLFKDSYSGSLMDLVGVYYGYYTFTPMVTIIAAYFFLTAEKMMIRGPIRIVVFSNLIYMILNTLMMIEISFYETSYVSPIYKLMVPMLGYFELVALYYSVHWSYKRAGEFDGRVAWSH